MIPHRVATLQVLEWLAIEPILMLDGDEDGYGARWTLSGQEVIPAIARYLLLEGFISEVGRTEFGARIFRLTALGRAFLESGVRWWSSLGWVQKIRAMIFG